MMQNLPLTKTLQLSLLLSMIGVLGNFLSLPVFFGVDFIFGSVFVALTLLYLGSLPAVFVGVVAASYTLVLWGHHYALIIFSCEAIFVSWLYHYRKYNIVFLDIFYWLLIGSPMAYVFYSEFLGLNDQTALFIAVKQSLNGIFNVVLAGIIHVSLQLIVSRESADGRSKSTINIVQFNTFLVAIMLAGVGPTLYYSKGLKNTEEQNLLQQLDFKIELIEARMDPKDLKGSLKSVVDQQYSILVLDNQNNEVFQSGEIFSRGGSGALSHSSVEQLMLWSPGSTKAAMKKWKQSYYVYSRFVVKDSIIYQVVLEKSAKELVAELNAEMLKPMVVLVLILLLGALLANLLSKLLIRPLVSICDESERLSQDLGEDRAPNFKMSGIKEYDELIVAMSGMFNRLEEKAFELQHKDLELERSNREIAASIERFKLAARVADIGVWYWDFSDNSLNWDNRMYALYEVPENLRNKELNYDFWRHSVHPDDLAGVEQKLHYAIQHGKIFDAEFRIILVDKSIRYIEAMAIQERDDAGKSVRMVGMNRDVTSDRLRDIELISAKENAEKANLAKSRFLACMSHELRTPMHAVMGFTKLAMKMAQDEKQKSHLENVCTSSKRLTNLLDDLLDLSKLEAGKMEVFFKKHDLIDLIQQAVNEVSSLLLDKNMTVDFDSSRKVYCVFDQPLMTRVVFNLLSNAIKFSPEGSTILINAEKVRRELPGYRQEIIQFSVRDHGKGIPEDELDTIFDRFVQSSRTDNGAGGTGLGLAIIKDIVTLHSGDVWVESPPQGDIQGSEFFIQFPATLTMSMDES